MKQYHYESFSDWLDEIENYGTRHERFLDEFHKSDTNRIRQWLEAAWNCARQQQEDNQ